ncbi:MAG: hypothetical protein R3343_11340 [Nitriliruptorales bacterium]|nr:hypothetical protein [Nitriliruptorales bacterium]
MAADGRDRRSEPPAYAWDWFARQRLLWRETRRRLAAASYPAAIRYHQVAEKGEVVLRLREDYGSDPVVRDVLRSVVADIAFLGRTDVAFEELGATNAPRGMRWWWIELTGEAIDKTRPARPARDDRQMTLEDVLEGYGD